MIKRSVPAAIGILVMPLNVLIDSVFFENEQAPSPPQPSVQCSQSLFFIPALGISIGVGGTSTISLALGAGDKQKALRTFGNQIALTLLVMVSNVALGLYSVDTLISAFGGKGTIFEPAKFTTSSYFMAFLSYC